MTWEVLAALIARYGVEFAYNLWLTVKDKREPTEEDWQSILKLANKPISVYLEESRQRTAQSSPG